MNLLREELVERLIYFMKYKINAAIVGKNGMGKTWLLKYLESFAPNSYYIECSSPKHIILQLLKKSGIIHKKSENLSELMEKAKKIKKASLLLDGYDRLSRPAKRILEDLRINIIASSEIELQNGFEILKINGFNDKELGIFLKRIIDSKEKYIKAYDFCKNYTDLSPLSIKRAAELFKKGLSHKEVFSINKFSSKKIEIFSPDSIVSIAYIMMSLRYVFYSQKNFLLGYALSTIA